METMFWRTLYSLMLHTRCRRSTLKYMDDMELRESLIKLDLYRKKRLCNLVFTSIEHYNKDQPYLLNYINVKGNRSIKHIMPQELSNEWRTTLVTMLRNFTRNENTESGISWSPHTTANTATARILTNEVTRTDSKKTRYLSIPH